MGGGCWIYDERAPPSLEFSFGLGSGPQLPLVPPCVEKATTCVWRRAFRFPRHFRMESTQKRVASLNTSNRTCLDSLPKRVVPVKCQTKRALAPQQPFPPKNQNHGNHQATKNQVQKPKRNDNKLTQSTKEPVPRLHLSSFAAWAALRRASCGARRSGAPVSCPKGAESCAGIAGTRRS